MLWKQKAVQWNMSFRGHEKSQERENTKEINFQCILCAKKLLNGLLIPLFKPAIITGRKLYFHFHGEIDSDRYWECLLGHSSEMESRLPVPNTRGQTVLLCTTSKKEEFLRILRLMFRKEI